MVVWDHGHENEIIISLKSQWDHGHQNNILIPLKSQLILVMQKNTDNCNINLSIIRSKSFIEEKAKLIN